MLDLNKAEFPEPSQNQGIVMPNKKFTNKSGKPNTSSTCNTHKDFEDNQPASNQHQLNAKPDISSGALIIVMQTSEGERKKLMIESKAAQIIKKSLQGYYAFDSGSQTWHQYMGSHWEPLQSPQLFDKELIRLLYSGSGEVGFRLPYKNGIKSLLADGIMLPLPVPVKAGLPFINGLLNLKSGELQHITPENALSWCLPYEYKKNADCPNIKSWLKTAVNGDEEITQFLRAWMAAVLHGRNDLQKFLHLKGSGGTGKGTFMRLLTALVGYINTAITNLYQLEQNRFETAALFNKRLAIISDSDKYGGSINTLKAITGQDPIRLERKHQQQAGSFIFPGLVVIASNESLQFTDHTSGPDRRRVTVIFDRRVTDEERQVWEKQGGEEAVLHSELPGLVNWLLELSADKISQIILNPPPQIRNANLEAMTASNPIAGWLIECCIPDLNAWTQMGDRREIKESGRETGYKNSDTWLYANYLLWCQRNSKISLSNGKFKEILIQTCVTLGHSVLEARHGKGKGIKGLRIKSIHEQYQW
ncbi:DNA primase family protein [Nitrosomonas communis]|uniref:Putative DNA primase/helicase n=1 Tax=Nitrosomonas communis TaxID=44574 RepID=A0A1I4V348_9PROT|nr:phage/plasmid primase, P4 family [Nitrosomonas communis]SFM95684.1 putative DNA primase/helicase [Nitrosomonas communis]